MQSAPYCDASRTPVQLSGGCGSRRVKSPTGAAAYGIPLPQTTERDRRRYTQPHYPASTSVSVIPTQIAKAKAHTHRKYLPSSVATPCSCPFAVVTIGFTSPTLGSPPSPFCGQKLKPTNVRSVDVTRPPHIIPVVAVPGDSLSLPQAARSRTRKFPTRQGRQKEQKKKQKRSAETNNRNDEKDTMRKESNRTP